MNEIIHHRSTYMITETKVTSESLTMLSYPPLRMIEDREGGICAIGQYYEDIDRDLYTIFQTNHHKLNVFVTFDGTKENEEDVIKRFNDLNNHLECVGILSSYFNDGFIRNRPTIRFTYTSKTNKQQIT